MSVMPPSPLSYTGEVATPYIVKSFAPTTSNNKFGVPTIWVDTANLDIYILSKNEYIAGVRTAEWVKVGNNTGTVEGIKVDAFTGPGTNPVVPVSVSGVQLIQITGGQVAAGTTANVIQTNSLAANEFTIQVQRASAQATTTIGANGVCHFYSNHFNVDSNAFVSVANPFINATAFTFQIPQIIITSSVAGTAQLNLINTDLTATNGTRLSIGNGGSGGGDPYLLFDVNGSAPQSWEMGVGHTAGTFQLTVNPTVATANITGTVVMSATSAGVVAFPTANGTAGVVIGGTSLGTNDALTITGEGTGVGGKLQLSMRASGTSEPVLSIWSGNAAVSAELSFGVAATGIWALGANAGASNALQIWSGAELGAGSRVFDINTAGSITKPLQPFFYADAGTAQTNVTGDGTIYTVQFNSLLYNVQSVFTGPSTFTAPVAGVYELTSYLSVSGGITSGSTDFFMAIGSQRVAQFQPGNMTPSGAEFVCGGTVLTYLAASATVSVSIKATGGGKTMSITTTNSFFTATLIG